MGDRYGAWTVVAQRLDERTLWLVRCDCGVEKWQQPGNVKRGKGCRACARLPSGEAARRRLLRCYKSGAKDRGLSWELTEDEFNELTKGCCAYCGVEPQQVARPRRERDTNTGDYLYNGIDRVDNDGGYITGNCVPCCGVCNMAKHGMTFDAWSTWLRRVATFNARVKS